MNHAEISQYARQIRLFALDLDGSALTSDRILTPRTAAAIQMLLDRGYLVVPTTGRSLSRSLGIYPTLSGAQYAISTNGALVTDLSTGQHLIQVTIPDLVAVQLIGNLLAERENYIYLNTLTTCRTAYRDSECIPDFRFTRKPMDLNPDTASSIQKWIMESNDPILEIGLHFTRDDGTTHYSAFAHKYPDLQCFSVGSNNVDFVGRGASKGIALRHLCQLLQISPQQVCAIGDNGNDMEMISFAGLGVAMGNAIPQLKAVADYVAATNDEEGVAEFLNDFFF